jgi:hypothetical protein
VNSGAAPGSEETIDRLVARACDLEARGFDTIWMANGFGFDATIIPVDAGAEARTLDFLQTRL